MPPDLVILLARLMPIPFVAAWGACIGSLINVLVYRLPRGQSVVFPASACPACGARLTWRENIPIFGWLLLKGKCRFCKSSISAEYPIVETLVAAIFGGLVALWYVIPNPYGGKGPVWLGFDWGSLQPEWTMNGLVTWPIMLVVLVMVASLVAMTIIDARTFTIPLVLPWAATLVAVVVHPLAAAYVQWDRGLLRHTAPTQDGGFYRWSLDTPSRELIVACIGAVIGIGVALLLVKVGLIRRSFADYDEWEARALAEQKSEGGAGDAGPVVGGKTGTGTEAGTEGEPPLRPSPSLGTPPPVGPGEGGGGDPTELWIAYPHARREMVKELAFLAPAAILGYAGYALAGKYWATPTLPAGAVGMILDPGPPLWLAVLGGVLLGYLVGGGIVWMVRIFGSLAFGKEAMGMGDVHLLAAVGACMGWMDSIAAFFGAAFVGVGWAIVSAIGGKGAKRAMPYGPFLAIATVLVMVGKPALEWGLNLLLGVPAGVPPINIP